MLPKVVHDVVDSENELRMEHQQIPSVAWVVLDHHFQLLQHLDLLLSIALLNNLDQFILLLLLFDGRSTREDFTLEVDSTDLTYAPDSIVCLLGYLRAGVVDVDIALLIVLVLGFNTALVLQKEL